MCKWALKGGFCRRNSLYKTKRGWGGEKKRLMGLWPEVRMTSGCRNRVNLWVRWPSAPRLPCAAASYHRPGASSCRLSSVGQRICAGWLLRAVGERQAHAFHSVALGPQALVLWSREQNEGGQWAVYIRARQPWIKDGKGRRERERGREGGTKGGREGGGQGGEDRQDWDQGTDPTLLFLNTLRLSA